jgi:hypothetical protein
MEGGHQSQQEWVARHLAHDALFLEDCAKGDFFFDDGI